MHRRAQTASITLVGVGIVAVASFARPTGSDPPPDLPTPVSDRATVHAAAHPERQYPQPGWPLHASGDGFLVIDRDRPAVGSGRTVTYTVEVEPALRDEAEALSDQVTRALDDTSRGWGTQARLRQVADPANANIRIVLAEPATVDGLCAIAGYYTGGQYSCWNGQFAALNVMRWREGAPGFDSLDMYRTYQINHEFGHGLGHTHEYCGAYGSSAPVMMQQTKGLLGCRPNPWPQP